MKKSFLFLAIISIISCSSCFRQSEKEAESKIASPAVPSVEDVVMYEIFVRNFTGEGTFNAIIPHLDRLKKLGVNVILLMPIQPLGKENHKRTYGSPYPIQNYTEVNPDFGTKADFKKLVDSIHAKGMWIIIDEVANHTAWDISWVKDHPDWYTHDSVTKKIIPPNPDWSDVADLNFASVDLQKAMIHAMKYWIDSFSIDGYRCDAASTVPDSFWKECIGILRQQRPLLLLAESDSPTMYDDGFDVTYGWEMYACLKDVWSGKLPAAAVDSVLTKEQNKYPANYHAVRFITNHDETSRDDMPEVKFINRNGAKAAFVTMLTLPGTPLVYNGQEIGYPTEINLYGRYKIDWSANPDLQKWYSAVLNFFEGNDVLKKGTLDQFDPGNMKVLIYQRKLLGTDPLWVIVNTSNEEITAKLPITLQNKKLTDMISNEGIASEEMIKLRPYEYHVLNVE
ncbi:MAG TPA: alpha-amylase family glycosyl hydrolase [Chitinophagales bacterium]|nr:alpha-amylase family glycosyl hydrolase [Chitinophagales bacterium]